MVTMALPRKTTQVNRPVDICKEARDIQKWSSSDPMPCSELQKSEQHSRRARKATDCFVISSCFMNLFNDQWFLKRTAFAQCDCGIVRAHTSKKDLVLSTVTRGQNFIPCKCMFVARLYIQLGKRQHVLEHSGHTLKSRGGVRATLP